MGRVSDGALAAARDESQTADIPMAVTVLRETVDILVFMLLILLEETAPPDGALKRSCQCKQTQKFVIVLDVRQENLVKPAGKPRFVLQPYEARCYSFSKSRVTALGALSLD